MPSREERTGGVEPEVGAASGGHLAPGSPTGPLFDALDEPFPAARRQPGRIDTSYDDAGRLGERTESFSRPPESSTARADAAAATRQQVRKRTGARRVKRTIRHVDPFSVLKLSGFFYAIFLLVWLGIVAILYSIVEAMGVFDAAEDLGRALVLYEQVDITLGVVEKWALLIGLVVAVLGTLVNTLLAILYNVASDLFGGLELTFVERDS